MDAFNENQPFDLPGPRVLAEQLLARAWDDDVADGERLLLEQGARMIEHLIVRLAVASERDEARRT
ncbi:MAG: hypothetical protein ACKO4Z_13425, partial [Planctomycetota bacterium]